MRRTPLKLLLVASMAIAAPVYAETNFGKAASEIAQSLQAQDRDRNAYVQAQNLNTARGYRKYLKKFPKGAYRVNAERALATLGGSVTPGNPPPIGADNQSAASVEASIGLTRVQRIQIQKQLTSLGYSSGFADGLWGANTRSAVVRWQTANRLPATGYVTARQIQLIAQQAGPDAGSDGTAANDDLIEERLLGLTHAERREVQRWLTSLGYNAGVDGVFGRNTRLALAAWQRDGGLRASGYLTADQLRALRRDSGG